MADFFHLPAGIKEAGDQLIMLGVAGAAGAFFRAVLVPEQKIARRVVQGVAGALSALFLGGLLAHFINQLMDAGVYTYLGAGFLMGSAGEVFIKFLQERIMGKSNG